jgi:hypothetical protein
MSLNNMYGFVFVMDAHCVFCEVGIQSIPYIICLFGGVYKMSECLRVSGWVCV